MENNHIVSDPLTEHPLVIKKERAVSLQGCLKSFSKEQLVFLAKNSISEDESFFSYAKERLVSALNAAIRKRISYAFRYLPLYTYAFFLVLGMESEDNAAAGDDIIKKLLKKFPSKFEYEDLKRDAAEYLIENGFCFAFLPKGQNGIQYVIPDELYESVQKFMKDITQRSMEPGELYPFMMFGRLFASLYGVCPANIYMELYNRSVPSAITDKRLFLKYMEEAASLSDDYYFKDDSIVSTFIRSDEEIEYVLSRRKNFKPYMPDDEELSKKIGFDDYDEDNAAYKELVSWCGNFFEDADRGRSIAVSLCAYIKKGEPAAKTISDLLFSDKNANVALQEEIRKLLRIVSDFNNTCHLWTNWGHPPSEIIDAREKGAVDSVLTPEAIEEKNRHIDSVHIDLPDTCRSPSKDECEKQFELFDAYWNCEEGAPWHDVKNPQLKKLFASLKKYARFFDSISEESIHRLMDQWLASMWHKNANRGGTFGNQHWNYHVFRPVEKIGEDLFTCIDSDGTVLVIYSHAIGMEFGDTLTSMTVLIDAGGWYLTYGPVLKWRGIIPSDITYLAGHIARQQYELQGLTAVIHFNPCPFWALQNIAHIPPVFHKGEFVLCCSLECKFKNDVVPELPKTWTVEHAGKYTRWTYNQEDYLNSRCIYFNEKTKEVFLSAHNDDAFEKMLTQLKGHIDIGSHKSEKVSMTMESLSGNLLKTPQKLVRLEAIFGGGT